VEQTTELGGYNREARLACEHCERSCRIADLTDVAVKPGLTKQVCELCVKETKEWVAHLGDFHTCQS
jgi:hypothetical protein